MDLYFLPLQINESERLFALGGYHAHNDKIEKDDHFGRDNPDSGCL